MLIKFACFFLSLCTFCHLLFVCSAYIGHHIFIFGDTLANATEEVLMPKVLPWRRHRREHLNLSPPNPLLASLLPNTTTTLFHSHQLRRLQRTHWQKIGAKLIQVKSECFCSPIKWREHFLFFHFSSTRCKIITVIVAVVVAIIILCVVLILVLAKDKEAKPTTVTPTPTEYVPPPLPTGGKLVNTLVC